MKPDVLRKYLEAKHGAPPAAPALAGTATATTAATATVASASADQARDEGVYESISASYFLLRRGLAALAFAFPILLVVGAGLDHVQGSISAYYHYSVADPAEYGAGTMRNVFVGILWAIGVFLFFYKGYSAKEDWALNIAGVAAVAVSLLPMDWPPEPDVVRSVTATLHYVSAVTFFLCIAYVCIFRSGDTLRILRDAGRRRTFRLTYTILGALMIASPLGVLLIHLLSGRPERSLYVLLIEVAGVYVFSAFWLVKSREIAEIEKQ